MPHVFISYVRENGDVIDRLASELKSRGVTVWLDRNDIEPGARWRDAIKNAIRGGKFFLACFSREFNERDRSYMNEELTLAIDELRERPSNRIWFIPLLINETAIPSRRISSAEDLCDIQALRLYENWSDGVGRILRIIKYSDPASARIHSLIDTLKRPARHERLFALQQLGSIGPAAVDAVPALAEALEDQDADVRRSAADALGGIGPAGVPALAVALKDQDVAIRRSAADALRRIGPAAVDAVPALAEALKDQSEVRESAVDALRRIGPPAVPVLAEALKDVAVRWYVANALGRIGPAAAPALAKALKNQDARVRQFAADALGNIGPAGVPALIVALKDQDARVRRDAVFALWKIGPATADAVSALAKALKDQDADVRQFAAKALQKIGPAAIDAVPALAEALKDQDADVRRSAASALELLRQKS